MAKILACCNTLLFSNTFLTMYNILVTSICFGVLQASEMVFEVSQMVLEVSQIVRLLPVYIL